MQACEECLSLCLQEADVKARSRCINMLRDCADICAMSAQYMARGSHNAKQLCSSICDACAIDCAQFKDPHCQQCAAACKSCAAECRKMAQ
ncbi:four-helix bundle copper-binding protein [Sporomusa ovata]|uniref:four-helix bundle copper-binding protein n=1 Tax=Sporomusa ovata TaxID=2378 RepID=UPI0031F709C4